MKHILKFLTGALLLVTSHVHATAIEYTLDDLGSGSWQYNYIIINDSLTGTINEFTIYFELNKYENLSVVASPAVWDDLLVQPGSFIGLNDGYYDSYSALGVGAGESAGVFSVRFDWLVAGALPGDQDFEIVDPVTFAVLEDGRTSQTVVPLPGAMMLFIYGLGLLSATGLVRRRRV